MITQCALNEIEFHKLYRPVHYVRFFFIQHLQILYDFLLYYVEVPVDRPGMHFLLLLRFGNENVQVSFCCHSIVNNESKNKFNVSYRQLLSQTDANHIDCDATLHYER